MAEHVRREELKRDELSEALEKGFVFAEHHRRLLIYGVGGAAGLALVAYFTWTFVAGRRAKANDLLATCIRIFDAQVVDKDARPDDADHPTFASDTARLAAAKSAFDDLDAKYGSTGVGAVSEVYLAEIARQQGDLATARSLWQKFLDGHAKSPIAGAVRLDLIQLDREQGRGEQVVTDIKKMLDAPERPLPDDVLLYQLGLTYQKLGKDPEAKAAFRRIVDEHPQSPYFQTAAQLAGPAPS